MREPALFPAPTAPVRHLVHLSGGITSWATGRRVADRHGTDRLALLFADTLIEDQDNYRFLIEGAADILGLPLSSVADLAERARALPEDWDERRPLLFDLGAEATERLPGFYWIADGRHPWEVFEDERFIGNARRDPCSKHLKRVLLDRWRREHLDPEDVTVYVGLNWEEPERLEKLRAAEAKRVAKLKTDTAPWRFEAPLTDPPWESKPMLMDAARARRVEPPRLYDAKLGHANCGSACVKGGHAHWERVLHHYPGRYADWERREMVLMEELGSEWGILNDRSGGTRTPLTLKDFRERLEADTTDYDELDFGPTCGCALF